MLRGEAVRANGEDAFGEEQSGAGMLLREVESGFCCSANPPRKRLWAPPSGFELSGELSGVGGIGREGASSLVAKWTVNVRAATPACLAIRSTVSLP